MIKRILVALSGTPYTPIAVRYAVELGVGHEAQVTGVTVTDLARLANVGPVPVGAGASASALAEYRIQITEERVREEIKNFEQACRESGIVSCVEHETCDPLQ
ncbi:MAG: universal stress protein, partial [Planctomycetota bacterium]